MIRLSLAILLTTAVACASLFLGVGHVSLASLFGSQSNDVSWTLLMASRIPRTVALVLAGAGIAVSGTIMQMLARNRFVEPSTAGTVESAGLGMLLVLLCAPELPVIMKMLVAALFACAGTAMFLLLLRQIPLRSVLMVPLVGIMLGGVIGSVTTFIAYRFDMMQSVMAWTNGDFSTVLRGRYEILWIVFALTLVAYLIADRLTLAGMGEEFSSNLGLNYKRVVAGGLIIVSLVTAGVVVTAGIVPFLGLIVPNLVSLVFGDNLRRTLPWVAVSGALLVLICDMIGRTINAPYEIPVGAILGVVGSIFFLYLLLRRAARVA